MAIQFTAPTSALTRLGQGLLRVERELGTAEPLLQQLGVQVLREIAENFRVGGRPAWKPLAASTLAARRRGGSAQPLINTGKLRDSFDARVAPRKLTVFSKSPVAAYHEFGGTHWYDIRPRFAKALALPAGPYSLRYLGRSQPTGRGSFVFTPGTTKRVPKRLANRVGKVVVPFAQVTFVAKVHHPPLTARPMLPTPEQIVPLLEQIVTRYLDQHLGHVG